MSISFEEINDDHAGFDIGNLPETLFTLNTVISSIAYA